VKHSGCRNNVPSSFFGAIQIIRDYFLALF
jgi:hypothetical protein